MASNAPNTESAAKRVQAPELDGDATIASLADTNAIESAAAPRRTRKARGATSAAKSAASATPTSPTR